MIPLASPERILLDFVSALINACRSAFPNATITGGTFHLTQSGMRKVNEIGMKPDYKKNDSLTIGSSLIPALPMVPSSDVTDFFILAGNTPGNKRCQSF